MSTANFVMLFFVYVQTGIGYIGNSSNIELHYFTQAACEKAGEEIKKQFTKQSVKFYYACVEKYTQ